jgi:hypothetical protein
MRLQAPIFGPGAYTPYRTLESRFYAFNEGLRRFRAQLGEGLFRDLMGMSAEARACFESDPENKTGATSRGKQIFADIETLVEKAWLQGLKARSDK